MSHDTVLTTTIREPSLTAGETELLLFAVERSRATFAWKCAGLDADGLRQRQPPSTMTLGGLLKHLALVEDCYAWRQLGEPMGAPWDTADFEADPDWAWTSAADDSPEELYALWHRASSRLQAAVEAALERGGLDQPTRYVTESGESPTLRRLLVDLHDEYARHAGHADLLREAVDGLVGEDPPQS